MLKKFGKFRTALQKSIFLLITEDPFRHNGSHIILSIDVLSMSKLIFFICQTLLLTLIITLSAQQYVTSVVRLRHHPLPPTPLSPICTSVHSYQVIATCTMHAKFV